MAELLSDEAITAGLAGLTGWRRDGLELVGESEHADFAAALAFVQAVGAAAQAADHHPDILLHDYRHVRLRVSTHSAGGLTQHDLDLAVAVMRLAPDR